MISKHWQDNELIFLWDTEVQAFRELGLPIIDLAYDQQRKRNHSFTWIAFSAYNISTHPISDVLDKFRLIHSVYTSSHTVRLAAMSLYGLNNIREDQREENIERYREGLTALLEECGKK